MIRCLAYTFTAIFKSRTRLVAENLCLRQQLIALKRRQARPQLRDADRRFWILACQFFSGWSRSLIVVKPDTVVSWHRKGWKAYWHWRSRRSSRKGRRKIKPELRELIRRMASEKTDHTSRIKTGSRRAASCLPMGSLTTPMEFLRPTAACWIRLPTLCTNSRDFQALSNAAVPPADCHVVSNEIIRLQQRVARIAIHVIYLAARAAPSNFQKFANVRLA